MTDSPAPILTLAELEDFDPHAPRGSRRRRFCCPLCGATKPLDAEHRSLSVDVDSGRWHCFRCEGRGKLREFWLPARQAGQIALRRAFRLEGSPPTPPFISRAAPTEEAQASEWRKREWQEFWAYSRPIANTAGATYLFERAVPVPLAGAAGARYSDDYFGRPAVLLPLTNQASDIVAVSGRYCDGGAPMSRSCGPLRLGLFATLGALCSQPIVICEAPIDALSLAAVGIAAVALCGTNWPVWLPIVTAFHAVAVAFDADAAGDAASERLCTVLASLGAQVTRWRPVGIKDWNEALCAGAGLPCWDCGTGSTYTPAALRSEDGRWRCSTHACNGVPPDENDAFQASVIDAPVYESADQLPMLESDTNTAPTLRGLALVALDHQQYPRLELSDGRRVGPGLLDWCPVLREMEAAQLQELPALTKRSRQ